MKTLEFNQYKKSDKAPFIIYADLEHIINKIGGSKNNPENSSPTKVTKHILSGFSFYVSISSFQIIQNKHDVCSGRDFIRKYCDFLRQHTMRIINFKRKTLKLLTNEQQEWYKNAKVYYICKEKFENKYLKDKKHHKVRDHCHYTEEYRGAAHSIYNLKYSVPKKILQFFHNGSNYDYHLIIN